MLVSTVGFASLVAIFSALLFLSERRSYPTHASGAILVTGASSGIGRDAALSLDALGYIVYAGVRKESDADSLRAERASLRPLILDVTKEDHCAAAAKQIAADKLPFVGLVNNAGISRRLPLEVEAMDEVRQLFDVNVFGLLHATRCASPHLFKWSQLAGAASEFGWY